ncbi:hypothetical protein Taro_030532 [Colocasia esculenta]|uniref:BZIP domain-containing protein n=1 Tax=Colocasia esculenta TaxID=4460 RepID=A0A843VPE5_COLES|nr:hypothetical protein [Colocasia esculenta]
MHPGEVASLRYLMPANPIPHPAHYGMVENSLPPFHLSMLFAPPAQASSYASAMLPAYELAPQASCVSNNSNSDEGDEQQRCLIEERKRRRMLSNRESARRSRMRKQRHLDELQWQVANLRSVNRRLIDELNHVIGDRDHTLQENGRLRDEANCLRQRLKSMQVDQNCPAPQDHPHEQAAAAAAEDDHPSNATTNQPASSTDLLH